MNVKVVQDSVIFISELTMEEFQKAMKFTPDATILYAKDEDNKTKAPVCAIGYADQGSVTSAGVVFDSTTDEGRLCTTILCVEGVSEHCTTETKKNCVSEKYASLILNVNALEAQIKKALAAKEKEIKKASDAVSVISI